jgi:hypothetical protein
MWSAPATYINLRPLDIALPIDQNYTVYWGPFCYANGVKFFLEEVKGNVDSFVTE